MNKSSNKEDLILGVSDSIVENIDGTNLSLNTDYNKFAQKFLIDSDEPSQTPNTKSKPEGLFNASELKQIQQQHQLEKLNKEASNTSDHNDQQRNLYRSFSPNIIQNPSSELQQIQQRVIINAQGQPQLLNMGQKNDSVNLSQNRSVSPKNHSVDNSFQNIQQQISNQQNNQKNQQQQLIQQQLMNQQQQLQQFQLQNLTQQQITQLALQQQQSGSQNQNGFIITGNENLQQQFIINQGNLQNIQIVSQQVTNFLLLKKN